uniref:iron-sulfur cluster assembly 1 homolog, mitochondrial-like n=1 Tax=Pristiophorus japonicus TaxID=55135 RepID=UPI00398EF928
MSGSILRASIRAVSARKRLVPTRTALTLTPLAVNKIKQLLQEKPQYVLHTPCREQTSLQPAVHPRSAADSRPQESERRRAGGHLRHSAVH